MCGRNLLRRAFAAKKYLFCYEKRTKAKIMKSAAAGLGVRHLASPPMISEQKMVKAEASDAITTGTRVAFRSGVRKLYDARPSK